MPDTTCSLMLVVGSLVVTQSHHWAHTRSFSQSPSKSVFQSSRPRLSVRGDVFPSYVERCGHCSAAPLSQVCGSDGKTYR